MRWMVLATVVGFALRAAAPSGARAQASGAQNPDVAQPDASVGAALENLAARAAIVFAGQVVAIQQHGGVVEIVFRVDKPVVGQVGSTYTLREWAGLWPPGQWRYRVGERAMVFLHGSSQAGFSSAVDGGEGVVPLVRGASSPGNPAGTEGGPLLDVRRLGTRVRREVGQTLPDAKTGAIALSDAVQLVQNWRTGIQREPTRRPLPPGAGVTPRTASGTVNRPGVQVVVRPGQQGPVKFLLQRGVDEAQ